MNEDTQLGYTWDLENIFTILTYNKNVTITDIYI